MTGIEVEYVQDSSSGFGVDICVCCLSEKVVLVKLASCKHIALLSSVPDFVISIIKHRVQHICINCHSILVKFARFRELVKENIKFLQYESNVKPNNNLFKLQQRPIELTSTLNSSSAESIGSVKVENFDTELKTDADPEVDPVQIVKNENTNLDIDYEVLLHPGDEFTNIKEEDTDAEFKIVKESVSKELRKKKRKKKNEERNIDKIMKLNNDFCGNFADEITVVDGPSSIPASSSTQERYESLQGYEGKIYGITLSQEEFEEERRRERLNSSFSKMNYKCESCILGFNYKETYDDHIKARHTVTSRSITCNICKAVLGKEATFKIHYARHFKRYECGRCFHRAKSLDTAVKHFSVHHEPLVKPQQYKCSQCGYETDVHRSYRYHLGRHRRMLECDVCHHTFAYPSLLKQHKKTVHEKAVIIKKHECDVCRKTFASRWSLTSHEKTVHSDLSVYCTKCKKHFKNKASLKVHLTNHRNHVCDDNKRYTCDHCKERFINKQNLTTHILNKHFPETRPRCPLCSKTFSNRRVIERHIDSVHYKKKDPKNKICDYCGRGFSTNVLLKVHIRTHTGERPLVCAACGASFAHPAALFTHRKLKHAGAGQQQLPSYPGPD